VAGEGELLRDHSLQGDTRRRLGHDRSVDQGRAATQLVGILAAVDEHAPGVAANASGQEHRDQKRALIRLHGDDHGHRSVDDQV
jgi:hypothetical protein